jgi:hypothetical protein
MALADDNGGLSHSICSILAQDVNSSFQKNDSSNEVLNLVMGSSILNFWWHGDEELNPLL